MARRVRYPAVDRRRYARLNPTLSAPVEMDASEPAVLRRIEGEARAYAQRELAAPRLPHAWGRASVVSACKAL